MRFRRFRYVLDVLAEPRDVEGLPTLLRLLVRDLRTDEVTAVGSFSDVQHLVERRLDAEGIAPREWDQPLAGRAGAVSWVGGVRGAGQRPRRRPGSVLTTLLARRRRRAAGVQSTSIFGFGGGTSRAGRRVGPRRGAVGLWKWSPAACESAVGKANVSFGCREAGVTGLREVAGHSNGSEQGCRDGPV